MPSPFPGMNPYLEQEDVWQDFHDRFIPALSDELTPQVRPHFIVKIEEHPYIHEPAAEQRIRLGSADVGIMPSSAVQSGGSLASATLVAPARIIFPSVEIEKQAYLEIRDRQNRELVAVVEVLSPTNKRPGPDREQYLAKRANLLRTKATFVEIDLLRGWPRMPDHEVPPCDYGVVVSRAPERPEGGFWPVQLRDPLPTIPVPLREPLVEAHVDLQQVLNTVYDRASYKDYIYQGKPQPPLSQEDQAWAASILARSS